MNKRAIIIDCDPGHDDAIALLLAFASEQLNVLGVTVTGGNQTLKKTLQNTKDVLEYAGIQTRIAAGWDTPLCRELEIAPEVHGESGLDGPKLPRSSYETDSLSATEFMRELIMQATQKVTIVATGPLTNVAVFLQTYPELKPSIEAISIMGGAVVGGNWTPAAEFNILVDPEAAKVVFHAGIPIIMAGLDVTNKALLYDEDTERMRSIGNKEAILVAELLDFFSKYHRELGYQGSPMHDPCAVAYLLAPEIFETKEYYVDVEVAGEFTTGATVADIHKITGETPNTTVLVGLNREKFVTLLCDAMQSYGDGGRNR